MSDRLQISTRKGLFTVARMKNGWTVANVDFMGDNVSLSLYDRRDGNRYAALDHGHFGVKMHRAEPDGEWREITTPVYPKKPEGVEEKDMWGREIEWSTSLIWALEEGGDDRPGVLWCGTLPGGLFRSEDRGDSWRLVESLWHHPRRTEWAGGGADLPGLHSVCVDPRNSDHVAIAVSTGGVWMSEDNGGNWELRGQGLRAEYVPDDLAHDPISQDVHRLVQCRSNPDRMWIQHHNGIFVSSDGGRQFTEITSAKPSAFGFPVVVHPEDPDTAWFVPEIKDEQRIPADGRVVVSRTRDGGKSFEVLSNGLPQNHAYHLVYRHALAIDGSGDRLAFGSTTGGLWISEDQGDSWQLISNDLPPVYAVTFA